jgi:hypothetical protein
MKKNNMLRIASVLLVAVLLSTCAISGVFARYYRTGSAADNAQVAKWGVAIAPNANDDGADKADLFYSSYDLNETASVLARGDYDVVAPGTSAAAWTPFVLSGTPEVDVEVKYTATVDLGANWNVPNAETADVNDTKFYCPLVFTVSNPDGADFVIKQDATNDTAEKLAAAVKNAIEMSSKTYAVSDTLNLEDAVVPTVAWTWAIDGSNVDDTALGDNALNADKIAKISISIQAELIQSGD